MKFILKFFLLLKLLQTQPQVKNMNIKYYDLYYTVIIKRDEKAIVNDKYENNENVQYNFYDFITPSLFFQMFFH